MTQIQKAEIADTSFLPILEKITGSKIAWGAIVIRCWLEPPEAACAGRG